MKIHERNRTDYEIFLDEYFEHIPVKKREHAAFMDDAMYRLGWQLGYNMTTEPKKYATADNPYRLNTIEWAAWYMGRDEAIAEKDFWIPLDRVM